MNWNEEYTRKKQKEMTRRAVAESKKKSKPLYSYPNLYTSNENSKFVVEERKRKERIVWRAGFVIISLVSALGIYAIYWASTS